MYTPIKTALVVATLAVAAQASAQVAFYEGEQFSGRSFSAEREVRNFKRFGFNDAASSAVVTNGRWEVCDQPRFEGRCMVLRPGSYPSLRAMGLNNRISSVQEISREARIADNRYAPIPRPVATVNANANANAVFYENENFRGATFTASDDMVDLRRSGFNDAASSVIVNNAPVQVCSAEAYRGDCVTLRPGRYPSLASMGLNDRVSSVRGLDRNVDPRRPVAAVPSVTFYEREAFGGRSFVAEREVANFQRFGFNDQASSAVVVGGPWELCPQAGYGGRCVVLTPGEYPTLRSMGLQNRVSSVRRGEALSAAAPLASPSSITFYPSTYFNGPPVTAERGFDDFRSLGMKTFAQSAEVVGGNWEVCPDREFAGQCMLLRPGRYPTLESMGLNERVESARASSVATANNPPRRGRDDTRYYEAQVTSVRAVVDTPEQRCWIDQEEAKRNPNVPAAIAGALLGGILGNQVGGGTGKDVATIGGVVAGAAIGSQIGKGGGETKEVRRCENLPAQAKTEYWDVTYNFRGREHRVQMKSAPGRTVMVNEAGELQS